MSKVIEVAVDAVANAAIAGRVIGPAFGDLRGRHVEIGTEVVTLLIVDSATENDAPLHIQHDLIEPRVARFMANLFGLLERMSKRSRNLGLFTFPDTREPSVDDGGSQLASSALVN